MIGYVFLEDRKSKMGKRIRVGGVLLFVREDLIAHEVEYDESDCETIFININIVGCGNLVVRVYHALPHTTG